MTKNDELVKQQCSEIIQALTALKEDDGVPKNVRSKIDTIITDLKDDSEMSMKVSKSLHNLDEISEDLNLPAFIRTQIWNVSSMLEKLNH
ncbi:MAG: UPF0147 family protein [Candidatus Woesearchaeota archaeon]